MIRDFLELINQKRAENYNNPNSISKKYDTFLESKGIYHSSNSALFKKSIQGRRDLCDGILELYQNAILDNERIMLLEDLRTIGYDTDSLVELILAPFTSDKRPGNLWEYADLLYSIRNFRYFNQYLSLISDESLGADRQMLVLLVGKSKNDAVIPILKQLLNDPTVYGHALEALTNYEGVEICQVMRQNLSADKEWIRATAKSYLSQRGIM